MSRTMTLDDIREAAEQKYGSFKVALDDGTVVELVNVLRLDKGRREELEEINKQVQAVSGTGDINQLILLLKRAITVVARDKSQANKLVKAVGDDPAILLEIFEGYGGQTQVGEA